VPRRDESRWWRFLRLRWLVAVLSAQRTLGLVATRVSQSLAESGRARPAA
jgi:hypothetical protein